jgi:hypothetical protein
VPRPDGAGIAAAAGDDLRAFEDAVAQIGQVEAALSYADLAGFNAPSPPKT